MSTWRERAGGAAPASVEGVVHAVRSSLRATHAIECVLLAVAAALMTRCALLLSAVPPGSSLGERLVLGLCAGLAAATWWLEHPVELAPIARELDQRLRHHGALLTAFDVERARHAPDSTGMGATGSGPSPAPTDMEELVRLRVLARLRRREALRAIFPPLLVPIGAPTVAALCLVLLADARHDEVPPEVDYGALAQGLERALAVGTLDAEIAGLAGEEEDGSLSRAQVQRLNRVLAARAALPFAPGEWQRDPGALHARVEDLDRTVTQLAREVDPRSELHDRLEEARTWLDALRMGLARSAPPGGPGTRGEGATEPPPDGTMSGSPGAAGAVPMAADTDLPPSSSTVPAVEPPAPGLAAGNWWPSEYDAVVERWVELTRAAREDGSGQGSERR